MSNKVQIFTPQSSAALDYVLRFVFDEFYGCGFVLVTERKAIDPETLLINYSTEGIPKSIQIIPSGYLFESDLSRYPAIEFDTWQGLPCFFGAQGMVPFDLFGAVFFLISRAEEYRSERRDSHGRFRAEYSLLDTAHIKRPLIDEWLKAFQSEFLNDKGIEFSERRFKWVNTYDIDVAYAFRHRPIGRRIAAFFKNLLYGDFHSIVKRYKVLHGNDPDPFDTYAFQEEIVKDYPCRSIYFFLLADKSKHDRNLSAKNAGMHDLIARVNAYAEVGIHPSYASVDQSVLLPKELGRLSKILGKDIDQSRQHFLRFSLPGTYRNLLKNGIREEFSMGYADCPGFRSGTCTPHYFFDLRKNEATPLKIYPLTVMDATLRDYQFLDFNLARKALFELIDRVKAVDGTFVSLWHNDTLQDRANNSWRQLYLEMATHISN